MKLKLFLLAFTISIVSYGQDFNVSMQVSKSDLEKNYYEKDSTANALVIYDYGNSFVDKNTFWLRAQFKQKIKILRTEGIERGEFEVKLFKGKKSKEKINNITGTTYNLDNNQIVKTELTNNAIFEEENENHITVKFVLPNVKVGSVITVSYETQSRFMTKYQPWYFQGKDPVLYSEYNTSIPANYNYHIKLTGGVPLDTENINIDRNCLSVGNNGSSDCTVSKYIMKNIPAYKFEEFTTTSQNYISRIEYELSEIAMFDGRIEKMSKTWKNINKELKNDDNFGKQISRKNLVKSILPKSISSINNNLSKAKAIYQFVLNNYKWNDKSERYDVSVKNLIKEKVGSVFEINLLLENLLSSEGFKVFPILISTRSNGLATKIYPALTDFNYVIIKTNIEGKDYFLDATNPYLSFGELPFRCLNQYGRLIDFENGSYWQDIKANKVSHRQHRVQLTSFENNMLSGIIESRYTGYHAHNLKRKYEENPLNYKERKKDKYSNIIINEHKVRGFDKTKIDFNEKMSINIETEFIGNKIYLNPFIIKFFKENPFKLQERTFPIDFGYRDTYSYTMKIDLNNKLKIIEIPESFRLVLPNKSGSFIFNLEKKEDQLILYFKVNFNYAIYAQEFYSYLKNFMNKVVETQKNTVIVLEKQ